MQAICDLVGDHIRDLFNAKVVFIGTLVQETGLEHQKYNIEKEKDFIPSHAVLIN